jgi:hypothetical protein
MSRVLVLYWEQNTPFIFLPDPDPDEPQEGSPSLMPHGYADKPWKKLADCFLMFPYYAEAYTLSGKHNTRLFLNMKDAILGLEFEIVILTSDSKF